MTDDGERPPDPVAGESSSESSSDSTAESTGEGRDGRRTTIMIVVAAVVVLAAIGLGIYLIADSGDDDGTADPARPTITGSTQPEVPSSSPPASRPPASPPAESPAPPADQNVAAVRTAAEDAATAINERDVNAMKQLSCDPDSVGSVEAFPPEATARLTANPQITGDKATAQIELSISGSEPSVVPLPLEKRGGKWCVP